MLGIKGDGAAEFIQTRDIDQAEEAWATIGVGEYWLDGVRVARKGELTSQQTERCEMVFLLADSRRRIEHESKKKCWRKGGGLR